MPVVAKVATKGEARQIDPEVKAKRITSVGRYALRIDFTSGCAAGIYDLRCFIIMANSLKLCKHESPSVYLNDLVGLGWSIG